MIAVIRFHPHVKVLPYPPRIMCIIYRHFVLFFSSPTAILFPVISIAISGGIGNIFLLLSKSYKVQIYLPKPKVVVSEAVSAAFFVFYFFI